MVLRQRGVGIAGPRARYRRPGRNPTKRSWSPFGLRLFVNLRGRNQAALAFVCCKRRASLAVTILPPTLQLPPFTSSIVPVDIELITDLRTMSHVWGGRHGYPHGERYGPIRIERRSDLIRTISSWLRPGTFAHIRPQSGPISIKHFRARIRKSGTQEKKKKFAEKGGEIYAQA